MWLFGKMRKHKCPDGRVVYAYRNADDAFPLKTDDWSAKFEAAVKGLEGVPAGGNVSVEIRKQASAFFAQLDEANRSMLPQFRAVYAVYQADPCNQSGFLAEETSKIIAMENQNRSRLIELEETRILSDPNWDEPKLRALFSHTKQALMPPEPSEKLKDEIGKVSKRTEDWKEG